ncbi:MAG TPA: hypothetical protein VFW00_03480 [Rhodocyclaceae bacterium]|nr:hypothetical protein [Rhodocyclaceae bacterium]
MKLLNKLLKAFALFALTASFSAANATGGTIWLQQIDNNKTLVAATSVRTFAMEVRFWMGGAYHYSMFTKALDVNFQGTHNILIGQSTASLVPDSKEFYADDVDGLAGNYLKMTSANNDNFSCARSGVDTPYCNLVITNNYPGLSDTASIVYVTVFYQDYNNAWHTESINTNWNFGSRYQKLRFWPGRVTSWVTDGDGYLEHASNSPGMLFVVPGNTP